LQKREDSTVCKLLFLPDFCFRQMIMRKRMI
jgi:hypothetical protein